MLSIKEIRQLTRSRNINRRINECKINIVKQKKSNWEYKLTLYLNLLLKRIVGIYLLVKYILQLNYIKNVLKETDKNE